METKKDPQQKTFIKFYNIFKKIKLNTLERTYLSQILSFEENGLSYYKTIKTESEDLCCSSRTTDRVIKHLIELGYISKEIRSGKNKYTKLTDKFYNEFNLKRHPNLETIKTSTLTDETITQPQPTIENKEITVEELFDKYKHIVEIPDEYNITVNMLGETKKTPKPKYSELYKAISGETLENISVLTDKFDNLTTMDLNHVRGNHKPSFYIN
jgi:Mn-dependent DtxR family transcriptional regulator